LEVDVSLIADHNAKQRFRATAHLVYDTMVALAEAARVPFPAMHVVGAYDFGRAVQDVFDEDKLALPEYTVERIAGTAMGKTISRNADSTRVTVIMDGRIWLPDVPEANAAGLALMVHEFTHALIARLRSLRPVTPHRIAPYECARQITLATVDEYRADSIANLVLGRYAQREVNGVQEPLRIVDIWGDLYDSQLVEALDKTVYPGWPDAVQRYQLSGNGLTEMVDTLYSETRGVLDLLGRRQAEAKSLGQDDIFDGPVADHPGVRLYLGPAWRAICETDFKLAPLLSIDEFARQDAALAEAGERALLSMWGTLGLTFKDLGREDGDYWVGVSAPAR
jgi:hypothetical protein